MNILDNNIKMNLKSTVILYIDITEMIFVTSVYWVLVSFVFIYAPNSMVQGYSSRAGLSSYSAGQKIPEPISQKYGVRVCTEFCWLRIVQVGVFLWRR
jgi:hypothetical protein